MMAALLARQCAFSGNGRMTLRAASTATHTATKKRPSTAGKLHAAPKILNVATGTVSKNHWRTHHPAEVAKHAREHIPKYIAAMKGVMGLPGPRAIAFENEETNQWTGLMFWESHSASQKAHHSKEHAQLMEGFAPFLDMTEMKEGEPEILHADFHYWAPVRECNYERYPVSVAVHHVKPGCREFVRKLVEKEDLAKWCHDNSILFAALAWNDAEDKVTVYIMYNDLLKFEAAAGEWPKKFAAWGMTEFMDLDKSTSVVHSNCFMYSE